MGDIFTNLNKNSREEIIINQIKILKCLARLETKIDSFAKYNLNQAPMSHQHTTTSTLNIKNVEPLKIIDNIECLDKFEKKLEQIEYKIQIINSMKSILGFNGEKINDGLNCCYCLVDYFFTRQLMTQCSWYGGSRNKTIIKKAFNLYPLILQVFFELILLADPQFTKVMCIEFFKKVLNNSVTRAVQRKIKRKSTIKKRATKLNNIEQNGTVELHVTRASQRTTQKESTIKIEPQDIEQSGTVEYTIDWIN